MRKEAKEMVSIQERRIREKRQAIKDMQNELELLCIQAYKYLRDVVNYYPLDCRSNSMALVDAYNTRKYGPGHVNPFFTKEDLNDELRQYEKCEQYLHDLFGAEEITGVCSTKNSSVAVCFDAFGRNWRLDVPATERIVLSDFVERGNEVFMLTLYYDEPGGAFKLVGSTFDADDLPNMMQSYVENKDE